MRLIFCLFLLSGSLYAKDFGMRAHCFRIQEESIEEFISRKMQSAKLDDTAGAAKKAQSPKPIPNITKCLNSRTFYYDPTYTAPEDILNEKGEVIIKKGETCNPLDHIKPSTNLLFLDGTDLAQISWAKSLDENTKWILINGKPIELEEELKRPIYFDQMGYYAHTFGIKHVPAKISPADRKLLIEEIALEDLAKEVK